MRLILAAIALVTLAGCADQASREVRRRHTFDFVKADISMSRIPEDNKVVRRATVSGEELDQLVAFFPGVGTGRRTSWAGGWVPSAEVILYRGDGSTARVTISPEFDFWSEEHGSWPLSPEFSPYLMKLLDAGATTQGAE